MEKPEPKIYLCPRDNCRVFEEQCEKCMMKEICKRQEIPPETER